MFTNEGTTKIIMSGLLLGQFMVMMDTTILDAVMGAIIVDIKGIDKIVWVTSAYLCTGLSGIPIFGKLADMYGRKQYFIYGLVIFLFGSILCSTATSMTQLSIYRAIQGIGGGSLIPIAFTIVFDIYPPEKRAMVGAVVGMVFGLADIIAPLLGAYITEYLSWRWVFYINLPLGLLSLMLIALFYKESSVKTKRQVDWSGAITLVGTVVSLIVTLELGGNKYSWDSLVIIILLASLLIFLIAFIYIEARAKEPIISYQLFKDKIFAASTVAYFLYGATFIVAIVYAPIFVQGVLGGSVIDAGMAIVPMTIATILGSQVSSFCMSRTSFRNIMSVSAIMLIVGNFLLSTVSPDVTFSLIVLYMVLIGGGMGVSFTVIQVAAIHNLDSGQYGAANSIVAFMSSLGMTVGISVFGIIQRNIFLGKLNNLFMVKDLSSVAIDPSSIMKPETRRYIPEPLLGKIVEALSTSITDTFMWATISAVLALLCVRLMGEERLKGSKKQPLVKENHEC